jgi:hypothetical protein
MTYRYLPPGKHSFFEYRPARQAKSPPTPKSTPRGDSLANAVGVAATQTASGQEVTANGETSTTVASSHEVALPGDSHPPQSDAISATLSALPETTCGSPADAGDPSPLAAPVDSVATGASETVRAARRPLASDDVARALVYIECGYSLRAAAAEIGRHHSTLIKRLRSDPALADALAAAREKARSVPLSQVREASKTSWRAAAWLVKYLDARDAR